jgi:excisionase family DNA binding protein
MNETPITPMPDREYFFVPEAARIMGVSPQLVYAMCEQGIIPNVKFGRLVRIPKKEFYEWLKKQNRAVG